MELGANAGRSKPCAPARIVAIGGTKKRLSAEVEEGDEEEPEAVHEVPVVGGDFGRYGKRRPVGLAEVADQNVEQRDHSGDQMRRVRGREDIEEATRRIRSNIEAHRHELAPRNDLADKKSHAKRRRCAPHRLETTQIIQREAATGQVDREAARQKHDGVDPDDRREAEVDPVFSGLAHEEGGGQRHEEHADRDHAEQERGLPFLARLRCVRAAWTEAAVIASAASMVVAVGRFSTTATAADVFHDKVDIVEYVSAGHAGRSLDLYLAKASEAVVPLWWLQVEPGGSNSEEAELVSAGLRS
jgi:hypothetical protein